MFLFTWIYIISVVYCVTKMYKAYNGRFDSNNPIGPTPGLETLAILVMAPVLMAVDVVATWVRKYQEKQVEKGEKIF